MTTAMATRLEALCCLCEDFNTRFSHVGVEKHTERSRSGRDGKTHDLVRVSRDESEAAERKQLSQR